MKKEGVVHNEFFDILETTLGPIYLVFSSALLVGISFQRPAGTLFKKTTFTALVKKELTEYFKNGRREFTFKTAFTEGTEFEQKVWNALKEIPFGETKTYKWLAARIGKPRAFRAVGNALGKNPIPIIFPCHRIIESAGTIGGYSSGTDKKRRLLETEYYIKLAKH